jgi:ribosomal protein S18 acetylase RimI-like enzyme
MFCVYRSLSGESFPRLYQAFARAFSDYAVDVSYMSEEALYNRALKNGIDFECSVGAYDGDDLVGFTMVGLGDWKGGPSAFDIGTGVVREWRGRGLARGMLDYAIARVRKRGVRRFALEVLQENEAALKAYRRAGFRVVREFDCFDLELEGSEFPERDGRGFEIKRVGREILPDFAGSLDWEPSWENSFSSIGRIPDDLVMYAANVEGSHAGLLVYYPALQWILSVVVKRPQRRGGVATRLVEHLANEIRGRIPNVFLLNVDSSDQGMVQWLGRMGFRRYVRQFEMELLL